MSWKRVISVVFTLLVFAAAAYIVRTLWVHYMDSPWTRDGRVRADVINIAPDVAGLVVEVAVKDNQQVRKGDLLLRIDDEHYRLALKQAEALVAARKAQLQMNQENAQRRTDLDALVVSKESRINASHLAHAAQADYQEALAQLEVARLNLSRTEVRAPVDGYVTNLNVFEGDFANRGEAALALVDSHSFYVYGYFEETRLPLIRVGDQAELRLMSGERLSGRVDSIARGIYDRDNPESRDLVADVNPTFNWVRLARRIPVRIRIDEVPEGVTLAAGLTCTVIVTPPADRPRPLPDRW
ncbi:HlyD family secretion protein [Azotobacter chroococcum]|jgi:multidrug resistance efflux pump|uniref:RND family efflux transporter MFP subunit n=1 Tax=Azotobacter chroococcum TaxID=353 RepID=A0A4R1PKA8_9GAMM|nr:HlyD family secretion protein [Azotobacter chroococcum]ASL28242.1 membrane protein [Azotobacter chroococcum]TBV99811.1 HlyD family secretion protein [Azotobacter chroococcum]TBW08422.1 HlyD family secretion protein [Azotobacter chroococcum]TBW31772.1 HlyD family secretion protein [Azotobacter chroococcum]TCL31539.1 RND family efflux transporter MFP subunit [Azotobacter chroococcum]